MKELNKHNLIEGLTSMPEYNPPESIWDGMESKLEQISSEYPLQKAIQELPSYNPPDAVWSSIAKQLPTANARIIKLNVVWKYAAAAIFLLGMMFILPDWLTPSDANATLSFSTEEIHDDVLKKDWNEDEDAYEYLMAICKEKTFACENPAFNDLKFELEELNDAKLALEEAIGGYGTNPELIAQMREIEFARTDLIKQMIDQLI